MGSHRELLKAMEVSPYGKIDSHVNQDDATPTIVPQRIKSKSPQY
jgi:hypothetical protein